MYSGTTFTNRSGSIIGGHQKIDRTAYKHLQIITKGARGFPTIKEILHFEGKNGPDGIKRKSPAKDEPWHFYDPFDEEDGELLGYIRTHYKNLIEEMRENNMEKAAFEAAWLAHAIVDGLTPAHHYPYEAKLLELRGSGIETRTSMAKKLMISGDTRLETVNKNLQLWGRQGLISNHIFFEIGVSTMIAPLKFPRAVPSEANLEKVREIGIEEWFERAAREIAMMDFYERFTKRGWTVKLVRQVRNNLAPVIIKTVCLAWYLALEEAYAKPSKRRPAKIAA